MSIKDIAPELPTEYLRNFFAEKDIAPRIFEKTSKSGLPHFVPNEVVVEHMKHIKDPEILRNLENTLRRIDFRDGDVNHFLEHLAGAVVEQYERDARLLAS